MTTDSNLRIDISRRATIRVAFYVLIIYFSVTAIMAISVKRAADTVADTKISSALAGGDAQLDILETKLAQLDRRFKNLKALLVPVRKLALVSKVAPPLDKQRLASEALLLRIEQDQAAALLAVELGRSSIALQDDFLGSDASLNDEQVQAEIVLALELVRSDSERLLDQLSVASETGAVIYELVQSGPINSLSARMATEEARLANVAEFSVLLADTLLQDLSLLEMTDEMLAAAQGFVRGETTIDELSLAVGEIVPAARRARDSAVSMASAAPPELAGTEYGDLISTIEQLNIALYDLLTGTDVVLESAVSSFNLVESSDVPLFDDGVVITRLIAGLRDDEDDLAVASEQIESGINSLAEISSSGIFSLGDSGTKLTDRVGFLTEMSGFLRYFPSLASKIFGTDGTKRSIFVLGQSSDELRAAGGFTSSAWLLTFDSGALVDNSYLKVIGFEDPESLDKYPEATPELQLHMDAGRMYIRDVGWDPQFEAVGAQAADLYEVRTGSEVDEVLSLTQWAIVELVSTLGGLETESGFIAPADLMGVIETGTDEVGTQFLATLFDSFIKGLSGAQIKTNFFDLIQVSAKLFASRDMMLYSEHADTQTLIRDIGWDGSLPPLSGDRLAIVDSNVGWNKVDRNIDRSFTYEIDLSDPSIPTSRLTLEYHNNSGSDDSVCDVQIHIGGTYQDLMEGCYWNYFRVYTPNGSVLTGGDELPLHEQSIAARVGGFVPGNRTLLQRSDDNGDYMSGLVAVSGGESRTIVIEYQLPEHVLIKGDRYIDYTLDVFMQAGTRLRSGKVCFKLPLGYELVESSVPLRAIGDGEYELEFTLSADKNIDLRLGKSPQ